MKVFDAAVSILQYSNTYILAFYKYINLGVISGLN
jgi:hypothetical protein